MVDLQKEMQESLSRIEAVFIPGRLSDKRDDMRRLQETGDTMLFAGGVQWSIDFIDYDQRLKGESESLNTAFGDMSACLAAMAKDHGEETQVICAVEASPEATGEEP
jgi:hypothetical protein